MGYDRIVYIRYHFSCGLDRKDACWLSFTPLTGCCHFLQLRNVSFFKAEVFQLMKSKDDSGYERDTRRTPLEEM